jgi:hypothetical protein
MAVPAATTQTYQQIGIREDLSDVIYDISPTETPVVSRISRVKAKNTNHEWLTDVLAAAASNRRIEGDDATFLTADPRTRLNNYCQISSKPVVVSGTSRAVDTAGLDDEFSYQIAKRGRELKRDIEFAVTQNQASSAGGAGTARSSASMESWIASNRTSVGSGTAQTTPGFSSGTVAAPTDSTVTGTVAEAQLKVVIRECWSVGGQPTMIVVGAATKQKLSGFSGIATQYRENSGVKQATILAAAAVYVSDFGEFRIVPDRFSRDRTLLGLDMEYWALAELRGMTTQELAKTGDSDKKQLITEWTLEARNEKANFKITDINPAL